MSNPLPPDTDRALLAALASRAFVPKPQTLAALQGATGRADLVQALEAFVQQGLVAVLSTGRATKYALSTDAAAALKAEADQRKSNEALAKAAAAQAKTAAAQAKAAAAQAKAAAKAEAKAAAAQAKTAAAEAKAAASAEAKAAAQAKAAAKAEAKAAAAAVRAQKKPALRGAAARLAELEQRLLGQILPRLERVEQALGLPGQPASKAPAAIAAPLTDALIQAALREADAAGRHGGLVPLPALRSALRARGIVDRAAVDAHLLDMERRFALDLKVSDDPRVPGAEEGIQVPGRGLVFFAVAR